MEPRTYWIIRCTRPGQENVIGYTTSPMSSRMAGNLQKYLGDAKSAVMQCFYRVDEYEKRVKQQKEHDGFNVPVLVFDDGWANRKICDAMYKEELPTREEYIRGR